MAEVLGERLMDVAELAEGLQALTEGTNQRLAVLEAGLRDLTAAYEEQNERLRMLEAEKVDRLKAVLELERANAGG